MKWSPVYLLFVGTLGLLYLERRSAMTPFEHNVVLLGILLLFEAFILAWLRSGDRL